MSVDGYPGDYQRVQSLKAWKRLIRMPMFIMLERLKCWGISSQTATYTGPAKGNDLASAQAEVYKELGHIEKDGLFWRTDIGYHPDQCDVSL